ncbi:hypothetical protein APHAL10511_001442 [Amanita phalloides]|nr:hypothetical protein APHAL10511_001442 [Amanita phalloides]
MPLGQISGRFFPNVSMHIEDTSLSRKFHNAHAVKIDDWSDPDEVVDPKIQIIKNSAREKFIIKRVALSEIKGQEFFEAENFATAGRLRGWFHEVNKENGKDIGYMYIGITTIGVPASESGLSPEKQAEARKIGIERYGDFHLFFDAGFNENKHFAFLPNKKYPYAEPILLRSAERHHGRSMRK